MRTKVQVTVEDGRLDGYLTSGEYGRKNGVSLMTVSRWVREGRIEGAIKVAGRYYIPCESVVPEKRKPGRKAAEW